MSKYLNKKAVLWLIQNNTQYTSMPPIERMFKKSIFGWTRHQVAVYLWEVAFVKPENIDWGEYNPSGELIS